MKKTIISFLLLTTTVMPCCAQMEGSKWIECQQNKSVSQPLLKGIFSLDGKTKNIVLNATSLGVYDVTVNGQRVSEHELKPGWTDFRKEVTYQTIDISKAVRKGENEILVQLCHGWWTGGITRNAYGVNEPLCFKAEVVADGKVIEQTDDSWMCSTDGPLLLGDIYLGETYDARRTPTSWSSAKTIDERNVRVIPFEGPEVRIRNKELWRHPLKTTNAFLPISFALSIWSALSASNILL